MTVFLSVAVLIAVGVTVQQPLLQVYWAVNSRVNLPKLSSPLNRAFRAVPGVLPNMQQLFASRREGLCSCATAPYNSLHMQSNRLVS